MTCYVRFFPQVTSISGSRHDATVAVSQRKRMAEVVILSVEEVIGTFLACVPLAKPEYHGLSKGG